MCSQGGPADEAGIQSGDVVLTFDGKDVEQMRDLPRIVADTPVGKEVPVVVFQKRQGRNRHRNGWPS